MSLYNMEVDELEYMTLDDFDGLEVDELDGLKWELEMEWFFRSEVEDEAWEFFHFLFRGIPHSFPKDASTHKV